MANRMTVRKIVLKKKQQENYVFGNKNAGNKFLLKSVLFNYNLGNNNALQHAYLS